MRPTYLAIRATNGGRGALLALNDNRRLIYRRDMTTRLGTKGKSLAALLSNLLKSMIYEL